MKRKVVDHILKQFLMSTIGKKSVLYSNYCVLAIENNCYSSAVKRRYDRSRLCKCINSLIVNYLPSHGATIGSILRSNNSSHSNFDNYIGNSKQIDLAMRTATKWLCLNGCAIRYTECFTKLPTQESLINCRATSFRFSNCVILAMSYQVNQSKEILRIYIIIV